MDQERIHSAADCSTESYRRILQEATLIKELDIGTAAKIAARILVKHSSVCYDYAIERKLLGDEILRCRRTAGRCYVLVKYLNSISDVANDLEAQYRLTQRWQLLLEIFSNPGVASRVFTRDRRLESRRVAMGLSQGRPLATLMALETKTEYDFECIGRAILFERYPDEVDCCIDFDAIKRFYEQLTLFLSAIRRENVMTMLQDPRLEESVEPLPLGDLQPQSVRIVLTKESISEGVDVISETLRKTLETHMRRVRKDITSIPNQPKVIDPWLPPLDEELPLINIARKSIKSPHMEGLRQHRRNTWALGQSVGTEGLQASTLSQAGTDNEIMQRLRMTQQTEAPMSSPLALRLAFVYLSWVMYEMSFMKEVVHCLMLWLMGINDRARMLLTQWLITQVPTAVLLEHVWLARATLHWAWSHIDYENFLRCYDAHRETTPQPAEWKLQGRFHADVALMEAATAYLHTLGVANQARRSFAEDSHGFSLALCASDGKVVILQSALTEDRWGRLGPEGSCLIDIDGFLISSEIEDGYLNEDTAGITPQVSEVVDMSTVGRPKQDDGLSVIAKYSRLGWLTLPPESAMEMDLFFYPSALGSYVKFNYATMLSSLSMMCSVRNNNMYSQIGHLVVIQKDHKITVRRDHLLRDAIRCLLHCTQAELRQNLVVKFEGEVGVDDGGVKKEFFLLLFEELFDPNYGLLDKTPNGECYKLARRLDDMLQDDDLEYFRFLGVLLGLAMHNQIVLDLRLPRALYKWICDEPVTMCDLVKEDEYVARSLWWLQNSTKGEFDGLGLLWNAEDSVLEVSVQFQLREDRRQDEVVMWEERFEYTKAYMEYRLVGCVQKQMDIVRVGFRKVISSAIIPALHITPDQLKDILEGDPTPLSVDCLEKNAKYANGYETGSETVTHLWRVLRELDQEQLKRFLWFNTGSVRAPIGSKSVQITVMRSGDKQCVPSAQTCYGIFMLPDYKDEYELRVKLAIALENVAGFGLV